MDLLGKNISEYTRDYNHGWSIRYRSLAEISLDDVKAGDKIIYLGYLIRHKKKAIHEVAQSNSMGIWVVQSNNSTENCTKKYRRNTQRS